MPHSRYGLGLELEAPNELFTQDEVGTQDLDRDVPLETLLMRHENLGETAAP